MKRKKLFFIVNALLPNDRAHGIQILQMCEAFAKHDLEVTLLLPKKYGIEPYDIQNFYKIPNVFSIKQLPVIPVPSFFGNVAFYIRWCTFVFSLFFFASLNIKSGDYVYTRGEMVLPLALFPKKIILCWETHIKPQRMKLYVKAIRKCKILVVATHIYKKELVEHFKIPTNKIIVEPDAVNLEKFSLSILKAEARKKLGLPQNKKIIIYTGSDKAWKGVRILKEAVRYLPGSYLAVFVGLIERDYHDDPRFLYTGFKRHKEIPLWLSAADFLIMAGNPAAIESQRYTSPLKMFEYMASERPIIAFNITSFLEILNLENAFIVTANEPNEIAQVILNINPNEARKRSKQAFADVQNYTWYKRTERILNFIQEKISYA